MPKHNFDLIIEDCKSMGLLIGRGGINKLKIVGKNFPIVETRSRFLKMTICIRIKDRKEMCFASNLRCV